LLLPYPSFWSFAVKHLVLTNCSALLTVAIIPLFCPSPLVDLIGLDKKVIDDDQDESITTHKKAPRTCALEDLCQAFEVL